MLVDIIFIIIAGKYFMQLAEQYGKSKWGYAVLGIISYYGAAFLFALGYGFILGLFFPDQFDVLDGSMLILLAVAFGLVVCIILYQILRRKWKREAKMIPSKNVIDEIGQS